MSENENFDLLKRNLARDLQAYLDAVMVTSAKDLEDYEHRKNMVNQYYNLTSSNTAYRNYIIEATKADVMRIRNRRQL